MTFSRGKDKASKGILDTLKAEERRVRKSKEKRIAVVKTRGYKRIS